MNNDIVTEILPLLPVRSLLRFRAVCKFWRHLIDSPSFRKLQNKKKNEDEAVYLQFTFQDSKLSIKLLDSKKEKSLKTLNILSQYVRLVGAVKGLICIGCSDIKLPIGICNPFLGEIKNLASSPVSLSRSCRIVWRKVGIGFDQDYKVVELLYCSKHGRIHAQLYSRATDSWRDLGDQEPLIILKPIKSSCKNGYFVHWLASSRYGYYDERIILSFDMKNEVFRTIRIPDYTKIKERGRIEILAMDECSFLLFCKVDKLVKIYKSRCQGSWELTSVDEPFFCGSTVPRYPSRRTEEYCVVLNFPLENEVIFYDCRAKQILGRSKLLSQNSEILLARSKLSAPEMSEILLGRSMLSAPEILEIHDSIIGRSIFEYKGSFISP